MGHLVQPCRTVEPIFDQVAKSYADNPKVGFLAVNTDEDESLVAPFLAHEKWTIIVLDRAGKIVYRMTGFASRDFSAALAKAVDTALLETR